MNLGGTRVNNLPPAVSSDNYYLVKPAHDAVLLGPYGSSGVVSAVHGLTVNESRKLED